MPSLDAIFKAYDVRGTVPDQLDPELAHAIGVGFATFAREESEGRGESVTRVLMARDMRPSGVELSAVFADGVRSQGLDVVDLGLGSTDLLYFASGSMGAPGVMFTASHNPAQYNGAKFCLSGARPVGEDTGLGRIREVGEASLAGSVPAAATTGTISSLDVLGAFADHVRSFVDVSSLAPLQIVADTANGMGGLIVPAVFSSLPFQLEVMYGELDGTFPNHPADPIQPANTEDLRRRVVEAGADVGLAFDGDADRVFLVDEKGVGLSGSIGYTEKPTVSYVPLQGQRFVTQLLSPMDDPLGSEMPINARITPSLTRKAVARMWSAITLSEGLARSAQPVAWPAAAISFSNRSIS